MKRDCSKILDFAHEAKRMCDYYQKKYGDCKKCPLTISNENRDCFDFEFVTQGEIDTLQKWSDEHPEKTNQEAMLEVFPDMIMESDGFLPCPKFLLRYKCTSGDCPQCRKDFWYAPYVEPEREDKK